MNTLINVKIPYMNLSIGIVGLPNVGKSTLFNALLKKQVANVANYPFCTIEPNVGVIEVPDARLPILAKIVQTEKIVPAIVEFYDIAGLVSGASKGEGLGNKFLAHIREVAAIVHVVRIFEDPDVVHVSNTLDPDSDIRTIKTELILADLSTLEKQPEPKLSATSEERLTYAAIQELKKHMDQGLTASQAPLSEDQKISLKHLNLLTMKPVIYVFNLSENQLANLSDTELKIKEVLKKESEQTPFIALCAKLENEILTLTQDEQKEYLNEYHLDEIGLNRLIKTAYSTLNLISFLTAGVKEARAWTIEKGTLAPQAAGVIHTDFEKNFIKADIVTYKDFVKLGGWTKAREMGKVQITGRDYQMKDDDIVDFKVGV